MSSNEHKVLRAIPFEILRGDGLETKNKNVGGGGHLQKKIKMCGGGAFAKKKNKNVCGGVQDFFPVRPPPEDFKWTGCQKC